MCIDLYLKGIHIGTVMRFAGGVATAYDPAGRPVGQYADIDAAAAALAARMEVTADAA